MTDMKKRYHNAEKLLPWNIQGLTLNTAPVFHWISERLFYYGKEEYRNGELVRHYRMIDALSGKERQLEKRVTFVKKRHIHSILII